MRSVFVDTSVWVDHFRHRNVALVGLLELDLVMVHPLVLGEIACGTPPIRSQTLADLSGLQQIQQASLDEAMQFIERERLFGLGVILPFCTGARSRNVMQLTSASEMAGDIIIFEQNLCFCSVLMQ